MGHRRRRLKRTRRASSADIRFAFVMIVLGAILLLLGGLLVSQIRENAWKDAAISAGILCVLLAIGGYSIVQKRRS